MKLYLPVYFIIVCCFFFWNAVKAQKLPNKQTVSMRAPSTVKIDGKADEWPEQLQAYNHATNIYYTIANDDNYLYLRIEATQQDVINKIINSAITFSIHKYGNKKDKNDVVSVTYPIVEGPPLFFNIKGTKWEATSADTVDTWVKTKNKILEQKCKTIGVKGVPGLDEFISVYNTHGFKVAGRFNPKRAYVCEFALAIKYLNIAASEPFKFSYHLVVNATPDSKLMFVNDGKQYPPMFNRILAKQANNASATDFWGEYTLAKKP